MPRFCAVYGCSSRSNREKDKKYFGFPGVRNRRGRDVPEGIKQRALWVKAIRRADLTETKIKNSSVCSDHFLTGKPAPLGETQNPDYVPSQKLGYESTILPGLGAPARHQRAERSLEETVEEDPPIFKEVEEELAEHLATETEVYEKTVVL